MAKKKIYAIERDKDNPQFKRYHTMYADLPAGGGGDSEIFNEYVDATDAQRNTALANVSNQTANSTTGKMGYKVLDPTKTFAEQVTSENTIYEIRDVFDLGGTQEAPVSVTLLAGSTLKFNGGIIKNCTLNGNNTSIDAPITKIFDTSVVINGSWNVSESYPEWFGAVTGVGISSETALSNSNAIEKSLSIPCNKLVLNGLYGISKPIGIADRVQVIKGKHAIGSQRYGIYAAPTFSFIEYDGNTVTGLFYPKSIAGIPIIFEDVWLSGGYHASTSVSQFSGHFVGIRMYRCYLFRFYEAGVIFNTSDNNSLFETKIEFCGVGVAGEGKKIDYEHPLSAPTTIISRPNHTIITNCQFHRCNVGIVFAYCSDVVLSDNLFGYNSLSSMFFFECHVVNISGNYIEGDCNYKFRIYKDRVGDPPSNIEISTGQEVEQSLLDMDVTYRSYIRIINSVVWIDELFNSNYYVRCYDGGDGNNYTNQNISGFDSIILITGVESSLQIDGMRNTASMILGGVNVGNIYDIISLESNQIINEIPINSKTMLRYRNFETPYNENFIRGMKTNCFNVGQYVDFGLETIPGAVRQCISPTDYSWDFFQYFNYTRKYRGVEFYKIQTNNQQRNTLRIDFSKLNKNVTYKLEIWYYNFVTTSYNIQAYYSDETNETIKIDSSTSSTNYSKLVYYFTKNQFVRDGKTCTYIYIVNTAITNSTYKAEISAIRLYIVGNPIPICMSNKLIGAYRPTPTSDEMVVFYDTTLNKPICWNGTAWVNLDGTSLS